MTTFIRTRCPTCGYLVDAHSAIGEKDAVPSPGNASVCLACGSLSIFETVLGTLRLRLPTDAEREEALDTPILVAAMLAHRQARANDPSWPRGPLEDAP